jgi:hypothetical protein
MEVPYVGDGSYIISPYDWGRLAIDLNLEGRENTRQEMPPLGAVASSEFSRFAARAGCLHPYHEYEIQPGRSEKEQTEGYQSSKPISISLFCFLNTPLSWLGNATQPSIVSSNSYSRFSSGSNCFFVFFGGGGLGGSGGGVFLRACNGAILSTEHEAFVNDEYDLTDGVPAAEFALLMISAMDVGFSSLARE